MNSPESTLERDLRAIDDALSGGTRHPEPDVRALQELTLALSAEAPRPEPEFAAALQERVEAGFPPARGSARARLARARGRLRATLPPRRPAATNLWAAGLVGLLLVAISAAVIALPKSGSGGGDDAGSVASSGGGGAERSAIPASGRAPEDTVQPPKRLKSSLSALQADIVPAPPAGFAPGRSDRKIERSVSLELASPVDEMERVGERVTTVTNRYGGFVLSSSLSTGEDGAGGDYNLRIPAAQLRPALRDLSALATVRSQSQSGRDVTRQHVTAHDRLSSARAERASLLRRLEAADTDEEAEALRRRLDLVAIEIRGLRSQLHGLRLRTNYSTVQVSLVGDEGDSGSGGGAFDDALDDAGNLLVGTAGVAIRALAVGVPLALLALAAWLGAAALRRRRRESALI